MHLFYPEDGGSKVLRNDGILIFYRNTTQRPNPEDLDLYAFPSASHHYAMYTQ